MVWIKWSLGIKAPFFYFYAMMWSYPIIFLYDHKVAHDVV